MQNHVPHGGRNRHRPAHHTAAPARTARAAAPRAAILHAGPTAATRTLLTALAAAFLGWAALAAAPSALAHDALLESTPASGSELTVAPDSAVLRFSGELKPIGTQVVLTDETGAAHDAEASVSRDVLNVDFGSPLPDGEYTLVWRVVSSDGHPIEGRAADGSAVGFTVAAGPAGAASSSGAAADGGSPAADGGTGAAAPPVATSATASAPASAEAPASAAAAPEAAPAAAGGGLFGDVPPAVAWIVLSLATVAAAAVVLAKVRGRDR
ncbi:copper resistance CopC family protein [Arthrobacter halodurans]|uniref:Copper resistance protein CopC n=1 Tax=Arthrobacter halodurans TaxID=516699 RepID=A0ABV4URF9_9MICC